MKYRLPVTCYVLLLTDRELPKDPVTFGRIDAGDVQIIVRYRLIRLSQISASQMLALQRENLLPFVPLMQGDRRELETGAERLRRVSDERHQLELGLHFLVLGALRYNPQDLLDLIGREDMIIPIPPEVYKESPAIEFLIDKSKDHWKEEGSVEALSETLRLLIASRFPNLKVSQKIKRIRNAALLQRLCVEVIKLPSAAAVRARLDEAIKSQDQ
jgi:hypothetical protein